MGSVIQEILTWSPTAHDLKQGDLLRNQGVLPLPCPCVVVVSQSCDLARQHKIGILCGPRFEAAMVAPVWDLGDWVRQKYPSKINFSNTVVQRAIQWSDRSFACVAGPAEGGRLVLDTQVLYPVVLMLNTASGLSLEPYDQLLQYRRASMNSPWRERLGELVAANFGRVATEDVQNEELVSVFQTLPKPQT